MPCGSILYDFVGYIRELAFIVKKDHTLNLKYYEQKESIY